MDWESSEKNVHLSYNWISQKSNRFSSVNRYLITYLPQLISLGICWIKGISYLCNSKNIDMEIHQTWQMNRGSNYRANFWCSISQFKNGNNMYVRLLKLIGALIVEKWFNFSVNWHSINYKNINNRSNLWFNTKSYC